MRRLLLVVIVLSLLPVLASAAGLSEAARRGRRIYLDGEGRGPIVARLMGPQITALGSAFPCVSCHRADGAGVREAGVTTADITQATLTKDFDGPRPSGRTHAPYTDATLERAVTAGVDPGGNALHEVHPRYSMEAGDLDDLVAYLKVLGGEAVAGLSETEIRVGMLLPDRGPLTAAATPVTDLLQGYFADVNARGGLHRRMLRLVTVSFDPTRRESAADAARDAIERESVFCFLANLGVPPEDPSQALLEAAKVPVIAPLQVSGRDGYGAGRHIFHVYATVHDQARVMVDFVAEVAATTPARLALVHSAEAIGEAGATGAREQTTRRGLTLAADVVFAAGRLAAPDVVRQLRSAAVDTVLFFGSGADAVAFLEAADRERWRPRVVAPAPMVGLAVLALPADVARTVYLASPVAGLDATSRDAVAFVHLAAKHAAPGEFSSFQVVAYAGAKLLEEGLRRSGRDVTRARLVDALAGLWAFPTGVTPALTYGENRRVGVQGAQILAIDTRHERLLVVAPWREPR
jgi:ABC-type branched-subunit amino acid transport system substrate-binding protein